MYSWHKDSICKKNPFQGTSRGHGPVLSKSSWALLLEQNGCGRHMALERTYILSNWFVMTQVQFIRCSHSLAYAQSAHFFDLQKTESRKIFYLPHGLKITYSKGWIYLLRESWSWGLEILPFSFCLDLQRMFMIDFFLSYHVEIGLAQQMFVIWHLEVITRDTFIWFLFQNICCQSKSLMWG